MSTTLQQTINWAQTFVQYAPLTAGVGNELAISIANEVVSTITAAPFTWPWNRAEYTELILQEGVQDYTVPLANFGFLEKVALITANGKYAYEIKDVYNTLPLGVSISDYAEPKAVSVGLAPGLDSNADVGFGYGYSTSVDTAIISQNSYDSASLSGVGSVVANLTSVFTPSPSLNTLAGGNSCYGAGSGVGHMYVYGLDTEAIQQGQLMVVLGWTVDVSTPPTGIVISDPNNNTWIPVCAPTSFTTTNDYAQAYFYYALSNQVINSHEYTITVNSSPSASTAGEFTFSTWNNTGGLIQAGTPGVSAPGGSGSPFTPPSLTTSQSAVVLAMYVSLLGNIPNANWCPADPNNSNSFEGLSAWQNPPLPTPSANIYSPPGTYSITMDLTAGFPLVGCVAVLAAFSAT